MARVPTLDLPTVGASDGPSGGFSQPDARPDFSTLTEGGRALQQAGSDFANIQAQKFQLANQIRVNDAVNQLKERQAALTYDPDQGYAQKKGINAFENNGGAYNLVQDYGDKLNSAASDIGAGLTNPAQQRAFQQAAGNIHAGFTQDLHAHVGQEFKSYGMSVQDGMIQNNVDAMQRFGADPSDQGRAKYDGATSALKAAVFQKGQLLGQSAEAIEAETRDQLSKAHATVAAGLLQNNDFSTAQGYIDAHKTEINAPELLQLQSGITKQQVSTYATNLASKAFYGSGAGDPYSPASQMFPSDMGRLTNLVEGAESNHRETNAAGGVLTSSAGAKGSMQVMDGTNRDPGFGVRPAQDNSPEERARVGREYLPKLIQHYGGDVVHALQAYNWGPGNMDAFLKTGAGVKGQPMPSETVNYANAIYARYKGGAGNPSASQHQTTLSDIYKTIQADPFLAAHPEGMQAAMDHARTLYQAEKEDRSSADDQALADIQRQVYANGGTVTPQTLAQTPDSKIGEVLSFGQKVQEVTRNPIKTSDPIIYGSLLQRAMNGDITDPNSKEMLHASLSLTNSDYQKLQEVVAKTSSKDQQQLDHNNLAQRTIGMLGPDLQAAGINPHPKDSDSQSAKDAATAYNGQLYDQLTRAQIAKGKPLTSMEARKVGLDLLTQVKGTGGWFHADKRAYELPGADAGFKLMTPSVRNQIAARLTANGIPVTDANVKRAYAAIQVE